MRGKCWLTKIANRGSPGKRKENPELNEVQNCDGEVRSRNVFQVLEFAGMDRHTNDQYAHISLLHFCIKFVLFY